MSSGQLEAPVALVLFRRPERTQRVFEAIRGVRPRRLFLIVVRLSAHDRRTNRPAAER